MSKTLRGGPPPRLSRQFRPSPALVAGRPKLFPVVDSAPAGVAIATGGLRRVCAPGTGPVCAMALRGVPHTPVGGVTMKSRSLRRTNNRSLPRVRRNRPMAERLENRRLLSVTSVFELDGNAVTSITHDWD